MTDVEVLQWLFITGFATTFAAIVCDAVDRRRQIGPAPMLLNLVAAATFVAVGVGALRGHSLYLDAHRLLELPTAGLAVDRLAGFFLVVCFGIALPVLLACVSWSSTLRRGVGGATALLIGAMALVISANDAFVLIAGWELLSLSFYFLAGLPGRRTAARAAMGTLSFGKVGGVLLLVGLLLLAAPNDWSFTHLVSHPGLRHDVCYLLLIAGFASKVGVIPFHVWIPATYESAPGPLRALMAGAAVNVGFYGMWRTTDLLGRPPLLLVVVVLIAGGVTAILGIAHAAVHTHLMRMIAYSSVENAGLITTGFGVALAGRYVEDSRLMAAGLLAATLQLVAHGLAKALLFTAAADPEHAARCDELDGLRGIGRRHRWSGFGLTVGAFTLAGLPLTIGFISEWFLLEGLMQQFRLAGLGLKLAMAVTGAFVALTVGFASVTFVRLVAFVVLGSPSSEPESSRIEVGDGEAKAGGRATKALGNVGILLLSTSCLALAVLTPEEIRMVAAGLDPLVDPSIVLGSLKGPWVVQPVFPDFSILSPTWLWLVLPGMLLLTLAGTLLASRGRILRVRRVPAWRSATHGVVGRDQYTAFGYTNPTRKLLAGILATRAEVRVLERETGGEAGFEHRGIAGIRLGYTSDVVEVVGNFVYRPVLRALRRVVRWVQGLQSGRLEAYLGYLLATLITVIIVVVMA